MDPLDPLSPRQRDRIATWFPGAVVEHDHSWGLVSTRVLQIRCAGERFIVKAAAPDDRHLIRELRAHREWLRPWTSRRLAPVLRYAAPEDQILATEFLPGRLVEGDAAADDPGTYRQAGRLLALLHDQPGSVDEGHEARENATILAWLTKPHRIDPDVARQLRSEIESWPTPPARLVPTHGDWQPRNWLVDDQAAPGLDGRAPVVRAIDFGRAALRPAQTDLARLATQDFLRDRRFEAAFFEGYGPDPRDPPTWRGVQVRQAIGTAVWAHEVGDTAFEAHGLRMIAQLGRPR